MNLAEKDHLHYALNTIATWVVAALTVDQDVNNLMDWEAEQRNMPNSVSLKLSTYYFYDVAHWQIVAEGISEATHREAVAYLGQNPPPVPEAFTEPSYAWEAVFTHALTDYQQRAASRPAPDTAPSPGDYMETVCR